MTSREQRLITKYKEHVIIAMHTNLVEDIRPVPDGKLFMLFIRSDHVIPSCRNPGYYIMTDNDVRD